MDKFHDFLDVTEKIDHFLQEFEGFKFWFLNKFV
jgi:hypothetical protein